MQRTEPRTISQVELEGITEATMDTGSRILCQASAAQQREAKGKVDKNLFARQVTQDQRKIIISMHKEQQEMLVHIAPPKKAI